MHLQYKNTLKRLSCILIATLLLVATGTSFAEEAGKIEAFTGFVTVTNSDGEVRRLKPEDTFEDGDIISTGEESSVTFVLANGETITLGASETYTIAQSSDDSYGSEGKFAKRPLSSKSPILSAGAGGDLSQGIDAPATTPGVGGSPTN